MPITDPVKDALAWSAFHLPTRLMLPRLLGQGVPLAEMTLNPALHDDPTPLYEQLARNGRLLFGRHFGTTGAHQVCRDILRHQDFGVVDAFSTLPPISHRLVDWSLDPWAIGPVEPPSLLALDGPRHSLIRRLMSRSFTVRRVADMRPEVEAITEQLLDDIEKLLAETGRHEFDLIEAFASRLPVAMIARLLGVPDGDHEQLVEWGNEAAKTLDMGLSWSEFRGCKIVLREMHHYVDRHLRTLAADPRDDLMSQMLLDLAAIPEDERPTSAEVRSMALLVLGAGFETTVNLIGNAVVQLDREPAQLGALQTDEASWDNAVEETLRFDPPVMVTGRAAVRETSYDGRSIDRGYLMITVLGAANRDPEVFTNPGVFDVRRPNADQHLAFSAGAHFCLGAGLARLEASVALPALYRRFPNLRVVGRPVRRPTRTLRGYSELIVAV